MAEGAVGATEYRLTHVEKRCDKLFTDMYEGEGKENPSMTVRVDGLEKCVEKMVKESTDTRNMMIGTMLTVIGGIVTAFVCYKLGIRL
jgi:hypothetical protein